MFVVSRMSPVVELLAVVVLHELDPADEAVELVKLVQAQVQLALKVALVQQDNQMIVDGTAFC